MNSRRAAAAVAAAAVAALAVGVPATASASPIHYQHCGRPNLRATVNCRLARQVHEAWRETIEVNPVWDTQMLAGDVTWRGRDYTFMTWADDSDAFPGFEIGNHILGMTRAYVYWDEHCTFDGGFESCQ